MHKYILFGNPNVGKTSIFNFLTNSNEHVSNYEGVTVSQKTASLKQSNDVLVDIPGVYSINSFSIAEDISQKTLLEEQFDGIIDVLNINDLKRNMYLLIDLLETGKNVNAIFNLNDVFTGTVDLDIFKEHLPINIFATNHTSYQNDLQNVTAFKHNDFKLNYGDKIELVIEELIKNYSNSNVNLNPRFFALQFLQGDDHLIEYFSNKDYILNLKKKLEDEVIEQNLARSLNGYIFRIRREYITSLLDKCYTTKAEIDELPFLNNTFDKYALHKFWGVLIFLFVMYLVFFVSVQASFLQDLVDGWVSTFSMYVEQILINNNVHEVIISFIINGAIAGVGAILVFLPQILILFTMLTIFESVGYFSRVNALLENIFNKLGMSASSMIPFISGFGCNVVGIMGTRTIQNEQKRISTIMASPFISCSARLPVYLIFVDIFFANNQTLVLLFLYILGIIIAILVIYVFDKIIYKNDDVQTIISLPKYRKIKVKYLLRLSFVKTKSFITNAGTLIFIGSMCLWFLSSFGFSGYTTSIETSFVGFLATKFNWILSPLGFGTIEAFSALVVSFLAKELAISALIVMYGATSIESLTPILQSHFTPASALSFMVFVLLYIPCLATLGAIYTETRHIKYPIYSILLSLGLGYVVSFIIYNISLLFM